MRIVAQPCRLSKEGCAAEILFPGRLGLGPFHLPYLFIAAASMAGAHAPTLDMHAWPVLQTCHPFAFMVSTSDSAINAPAAHILTGKKIRCKKGLTRGIIRITM